MPAHAVPFDVLVDYAIGELPADRETALEAHLFECETCAGSLEWLMQVSAGIVGTVAAGAISVAATGDLVESIRRRGIGVREYTIAPGGTVQCTASPDDVFVAIGLAGLSAAAGDAEVATSFEDLESGVRGEQPTLTVPTDTALDRAIVLFPGDLVRSYPRSRWTMRVTGAGGRAGTYTLEHTPWEQLSDRERRLR